MFWQKKGTIGIILFVFFLLAFIFTMLQPLTYEAKSKLLVIQSAPAGADPYALSRSNAYLSVVLADIVSTYSFYNEVMDGGFGAERRWLESDDNIDKTLKNWKKSVRVVSLGDTGAIEIKVVHQEKEQAKKIAEGIFGVLENKHMLFHGSGENVRIKTVDPAIVSQKTPNVAVNFGVALVLGACLSLLYVLQYPEKEHDLKLSVKKGNSAKASEAEGEELFRAKEAVFS